MTTKRLSELQDLALAGKNPDVLNDEEAAAWEEIRDRVQTYNQSIQDILRKLL